MRKSKKFDFAEGKYYFNVHNGAQTITIHRVAKDAAMESYKNYKKVGKRVEWLGVWDGKKFTDDKDPVNN